MGADEQRVRFIVGDQVQAFPRSDVQQVLFGSAEIASSTPPTVPGPTPTPPPPPPPPTPTRAAPFEQTMAGIRWRLDQCRRTAADSVVCAFTAESPSKDTDLFLWGYQSTAVDSKGIQRNGGGATVGSSSGQTASSVVVEGVPVHAELHISGLDPNADRIALLRVVFGICGSSGCGNTLEFRNVPLN
jgi:hypothetical protein